jgi:hypothetical protein
MRGGNKYMARAKNTSISTSPKKRRPATTPEAREDQMISYAMDLVEQRLLDGTASSQETTHFLKLAAQKEKRQLEMDKIKNENKLLQAKTEDLQRQKSSEEFYGQVLAAIRNYNGQGDPEEYEDY